MTGFTSLPLGPSPSSDVGRGLLRMSGAMMRRAGLQAGEVLTLGGARISHARALPWSNQECLGCDPILARNLGLSWGAVPEISAANLGEIHRFELMVEEGQRLVGAAQDWSVWLRDMAVTRGDFLGRSAQPSHLIRADALFDAQGAPLDAGLVTAKTQIVLPNVARSFAGIGGLASEIASVREVIELPLTHPALFTRLGITPPARDPVHRSPRNRKNPARAPRRGGMQLRILSYRGAGDHVETLWRERSDASRSL